MTITLAPAPFVTNPLTKCGSYSDKRSAGGPEGLLARMVGFKRSGASMHAHRYNGQADGTHMAPPSGGGQFPRDLTVPATAVYVVWSYSTPIAWVDEDGTVTIPDVYYSVTTTQQQNRCRAWLGAAVDGTSTHRHHVAEGYRSA
jgi:hypothetical protein